MGVDGEAETGASSPPPVKPVTAGESGAPSGANLDRPPLQK